MTPTELRVHHLDHDHFNNTPTNLTAAHDRCHKTYHQTGRPSGMTGKRHSLETRQQMSVSLRKAYAEGRGPMSNLETRLKLSQTVRGRPGHPRSPETRRKIGIGSRKTRLAERVTCEYCGLVSNAGAIARHKKAKHP